METINDTAAWGALVGAVMPFLIAIVQQPFWSTRQRQVVALVASAIAGVLTVFASGQFNLENWVVTLAVVIGAAQTTYTVLKDPALAVERATSKRQHDEAGVTDVLGATLMALVGLSVLMACLMRVALTGTSIL